MEHYQHCKSNLTEHLVIINLFYSIIKEKKLVEK